MIHRAFYALPGALAGYLLYAVTGTFGPASILVNLLTPLPAAYLVMRYGVACGWLAILLTTGLTVVTGSLQAGLLYFLQFGLVSAVLPWLLLRRVAWDRAVGLTLVVVMLASMAGLTIAAASQGQSPFTYADQLIGNEIANATAFLDEMFAEAEMAPGEAAQLKEAVANMAAFMRTAYAGLAIMVSGMLMLGLVLLLSLCGRNRYEIPGVAFSAWKVPEPLIWILIVAGFVTAFADGFARTFSLNLLVVLLPLYFLQGLAVLDCFFRRKALSPMIRAFGYMVVTLVNPLPVLLTAVGVFDLWIDFRKPRTSKT